MVHSGNLQLLKPYFLRHEKFLPKVSPFTIPIPIRPFPTHPNGWDVCAAKKTNSLGKVSGKIQTNQVRNPFPFGSI